MRFFLLALAVPDSHILRSAEHEELQRFGQHFRTRLRLARRRQIKRAPHEFRNRQTAHVVGRPMCQTSALGHPRPAAVCAQTLGTRYARTSAVVMRPTQIRMLLTDPAVSADVSRRDGSAAARHNVDHHTALVTGTGALLCGLSQVSDPLATVVHVSPSCARLQPSRRPGTRRRRQGVPVFYQNPVEYGFTAGFLADSNGLT
jgi:hypothetical protein